MLMVITLGSCAELKRTTSLSPAIEMKNDAGKNSVGIESRLQEWNLDDLSIQNKRVNYIRAGISMMLGHI